MPTQDKWAPRPFPIRDPRDANKKHGPFWNWPRYAYFGGRANGMKLDQSGGNKLNLAPDAKQNAVGPVSDRGKGR